MTEPGRPVKQVIVIRSDLGMRRGKEIAQGAHASMLWLSRRLTSAGLAPDAAPRFSPAEHLWLRGSFTKIVCRVRSLDELRDVVRAAEAAGVECHPVFDRGLTEFQGRVTVTAVAVGPDYEDLIDPVTGALELY